MTTSSIRKKVHQYVDEADSTILEVVHKMLEVYRQSNASYLTESQQTQALEASVKYKTGKSKAYTLSEVRSRIKKKLNS